MPLTPYGLREWLAITVVAAILAAAIGVFVGWSWTILVLVVWLALVSFFRDPIRRVPRDLDSNVMLSPADGTVSAVTEVVRHEAVDGPALIVRIFLSVLDVHVNRSPCEAVVEGMTYTPGKFLNAQSEESARVNEANLIMLRTTDGDPIGLRQVSGMIARRIVCRLEKGDHVTRGEKFGMIKFGSTAELILPRPASVTVHVKKGDKVKGGVTRLATLAPARQAVTTAAPSALRD